MDTWVGLKSNLYGRITAVICPQWTVTRYHLDVFWWGDAKNVMDYWANGLDQRLVLLGTQRTALTAAAN